MNKEVPMSEDSIQDMPFQRRSAPEVLRAAVEQLCQKRGMLIEELEQTPLGQIAEMARETYGAEMPEYWRVWHDWHDHGHPQPMGEL